MSHCCAFFSGSEGKGSGVGLQRVARDLHQHRPALPDSGGRGHIRDAAHLLSGSGVDHGGGVEGHLVPVQQEQTGYQSVQQTQLYTQLLHGAMWASSPQVTTTRQTTFFVTWLSLDIV